jgi:hypothetical protein
MFAKSLPYTFARSLRSTLALLVFALLCSVAAQSAHAQDDDDPDAVAQAKEHYRAGLDAYKAGHYDVAIRELKKAYLLKKLPPLLLNIGATYRKMGDLDLSLHFYQKFLDEAPSDAKDRPEVEHIIAELKTQKSAAASDSEPPPARKDDDNSAKEPRRGRGGEWNHTVIDAAPPETPIDVSVSSPVMKGVKVYVYYRGPGQADYSPILMKRHGREKVGRIPATAVSGTSLQYYIEAKDSAGTVVKSSGSQGNPNIIMIEEGVKPVMLASMGRTDGEEPAPEEEAPKARARNNDDDEEAAPKSGADLKTRPVHKKRAAGEGPSMLRKIGYGLLGGGAGVTVIGGALLGVGLHQANNVVADSKNPIDGNGNKIFYNNDPNAGGAGQEAHLYSQAKTLAGVGDAFLGIGIAAVVAGVACVVADVVSNGDDHPKAAKKTKKPAAHPVVDDEVRNWFIAPSGSPTSVGLAGGFSF